MLGFVLYGECLNMEKGSCAAETDQEAKELPAEIAGCCSVEGFRKISKKAWKEIIPILNRYGVNIVQISRTVIYRTLKIVLHRDGDTRTVPGVSSKILPFRLFTGIIILRENI